MWFISGGPSWLYPVAIGALMIAIQIRVNGKLVATCGTEPLRQVAAMVAARRPGAVAGPGSAYAGECMSVRSGDPGTDEVLKWVSTRIAFGDEVSLKFVAAPQAQVPNDRQDLPARPRSDG